MQAEGVGLDKAEDTANGRPLLLKDACCACAGQREWTDGVEKVGEGGLGRHGRGLAGERVQRDHIVMRTRTPGGLWPTIAHRSKGVSQLEASTREPLPTRTAFFKLVQLARQVDHTPVEPVVGCRVLVNDTQHIAPRTGGGAAPSQRQRDVSAAGNTFQCETVWDERAGLQSGALQIQDLVSLVVTKT